MQTTKNADSKPIVSVALNRIVAEVKRDALALDNNGNRYNRTYHRHNRS